VSALLVIYVDASVAHHLPERPVGWGAVFIRGNRVVEASGTFERVKSEGSALAELQAVHAALRHARDAKLLRRGDSVIIASDCTTVEVYLGDRRLKTRHHAYCEVRDRILALGERHKLNLIPSHVKGHQHNGSECPHKEFNKRADALARYASGVRQDPAVANARHAQRRRA